MKKVYLLILIPLVLLVLHSCSNNEAKLNYTNLTQNIENTLSDNTKDPVDKTENITPVIQDKSLSNSTLSNSSLSNSTLSNSTLSNSTLSNSTLSNSTLSNSTLSNSTLSNSTLSDSTLGDSTLAKNVNETENKITIVLDPGHSNKANLEVEPISPGSSEMKIKDGGGATGVVSGVQENTINLKVGLLLRDILTNKGYRVVMTKTDPNESLGNIERAEIGNRENADLVLRIHCDSNNDQSAHGASMLVPKAINENTRKIYDESARCGQIVLDSLCNYASIYNRGLIYTDQMTGFNWSKVPVILVEMGFLSNPDEDMLLNSEDYEEKLAYGLFLGIEKCFYMEGI